MSEDDEATSIGLFKDLGVRRRCGQSDQWIASNPCSARKGIQSGLRFMSTSSFMRREEGSHFPQLAKRLCESVADVLLFEEGLRLKDLGIGGGNESDYAGKSPSEQCS